jgi:simple sugar transport system permease protein
MSLLPILVALTAAQAAPLVLAALGGVLSERSGIVNIALEGMMLAGAFAGVTVAPTAGLGVGLGAALAVGGCIGLAHWFATQRLNVDHIISGVAINLLAINLTTYLLRVEFIAAGRDAMVQATIPVGAFVIAAAALAIAAHALLYYTPFGLRLRASGEDPESVRMAGIDPGRLRMASVVLSGVLAAAGGACLSLSITPRFSDNMSGGRGFIALAAVVCGRWTPLGATAAAVVFGFFEALQTVLQGRIPVPSELLQMAPYVSTILAAMLLRSRAPAALGRTEASALE